MDTSAALARKQRGVQLHCNLEEDDLHQEEELGACNAAIACVHASGAVMAAATPASCIFLRQSTPLRVSHLSYCTLDKKTLKEN